MAFAAHLRCWGLALAVITAVFNADATADENAVQWLDEDGVVAWTTVVDRAVDAKLVLLGEIHDNPHHHKAQADILRSMIANGRRPTVVWEMIDRDRQSDIDKFAATGSRDADAFANAVDWANGGWLDFDLYRPLIQVALAFDLPMIAADLSPQDMQRVHSVGIDKAFPHLAHRWSLTDLYGAEEMDQHVEAVYLGHCKLVPRDRLTAMVSGQIARDAALAATALDADKGDGVVLIAGNGHVRLDIGVPKLIRAADSSASLIVVGLSEGQTMSDRYDIIGVTTRVKRPDPCVQLRKHFKSATKSTTSE